MPLCSRKADSENEVKPATFRAVIRPRSAPTRKQIGDLLNSLTCNQIAHEPTA
jgi:hypothetical protein